LEKAKARRVVATLAMLLASVGLMGAGSSFAAVDQASQPVLEILVQPAAGVSIETISATYGAPVLGAIPCLGIYKLAGDGSLLAALQKDPAVARAEANTRAEPLEMQRRAFGTGSGYGFAASTSGQTVDTRYSQNWPSVQLQVAQAQRLALGKGVTVAIVDTGIDRDHPALASRLTAGYDFVASDSDPDDGPDGLDNDGDGIVDEGAGHGTHVAGIVAMVAPSARLMPVRVLDSEGIGAYFDIVAGIVYAVDHGAQVINLSLSGTEDDAFLKAAVDYAWDKGVVVVAAAGAYDVQYPARYEHVIAVGATDMRDQVAEFSDFRAGRVTVFAPGVSIYSTYYNGGYAWWTGTSMAAPFVSGELALLLSTKGCARECATARVKAAVRPVAPNLDPRGRIDVYQAVKTAASR
jgi:thermitase